MLEMIGRVIVGVGFLMGVYLFIEEGRGEGLKRFGIRIVGASMALGCLNILILMGR